MHAGLLGGGNITETHARAAREAGVTLTAVCGQNVSRIERLAREFGCTAYAGLEQFLAHRPMDFVIIGSPSGVHADQGIAAARLGLHVLVEKPIDVTTSRVDDLVAAAGAAGVTLGVIFQDRAKPALRRLKKMIDGGELGNLVLATAHVKWYRPPDYYSGSRWRGSATLDGGTLMNQGIHTIDLLRWLLGPVTAVGGRVATRLHAIQVEDTAVATLQFANGALATLETTTAAFPGYPRRVEITGTNGTVIVEGDEITEVRLKERDSQGGHQESNVAGVSAESVESRITNPKSRIPNPESRIPSPESRSAQSRVSASSPVVSDVGAHRAIIEDFVEAIRNGGSPACGGEEGRRSVAIIEAIHTSARTGRFVESSI